MITLTDHAKEQAKSRLGWNEPALARMAEKAMAEGVKHAETRGKLNRYITKLYLSHGSANNTRIYGEHIFLFAGPVLVTVLHLPHEMRQAARSAASHQSAIS